MPRSRPHSQLLRFCFILAFFALGGTPIPTFAYGDDEQDRNHPEIRWVTSETEHFRFHYEKRLRSVAQACAARAEAVYPEVVELFHHRPPGKIDFLVFDQDYSNGWAIASLNTMAIWSADLGFELRGSKDWIRDVVAHEFGHIVSIQSSSKVRPWLPEIQFGWSDASDRPIGSGGWLLWSLNPYSMSLAEGTAQWISERNGGDRWDTHRRMILRTAALSDSILPWNRMTVFSGSGLDFEKVYNHGYGMVRQVGADTPEQVVRWWKSLGKPLPQTVSGAWRVASEGRSADSLWSAWASRMKAVADSEVQSASPLVEGRRLFGQAFNTLHPRWWNDSLLLFSSNRGSDFQINSLWGCDLSRPDSAADSTRDSADRFWTVAPIIRSRFSVDSARSTVWFHSGRNDDPQGRPVLDIYSARLKPDDEGRIEAVGKKQQFRVTKGMHALAPSFRNDTLAVVVRDRRSFRVRLIPSDGLELPESEGTDLFPAPDSLGDWPANTIFSTRWHPDGRSLAVDWFDGNLRRVDRVALDGRILSRLGDSLHEWRDPAFDPDGRHIWISSDRTGIFNLYRQDLDSLTLEQATSVVGGAFEPAPAPDGKRLAFISWDIDGFALHLLDSVRLFAPRPAAPIAPRIQPPLRQTWDLASLERPYRSIPNRALVSPIVYAQRNPPILGNEAQDWKWMAGARLQLLDPVRRNMLFALGMLDLTNGFDFVGPGHRNFVNPRQEKLLMAGMENRSLPPTLTFDAAYQGMRGEDEIRSENPRDPDGDSLVSFEPWALHLTSLSAGARFSLSRNQKIHGSATWAGYDFDYYEFPFQFRGYSAVTPSIFWTWLDRSSWGSEDNRGTFARLQWSADIASLKRQGSFADVFQQNQNGSVTVRMTESVVHRALADFRWGLANPLLQDHTLEADASVSGVVSWDSEADTLDDFYLEGLSLPGYPMYQPGHDRERRLFQGRHTAFLSLSYKVPLWEIRKLAGIWFLDTWSAAASVQAGRAWSSDWIEGSLTDQIEDFSRSVVWETRLSGSIHSAYPLSLGVKFARALDEPGGLKQETAELFGLPTGAHRIEFGINLGLDEWAIIDQPSRHRLPSLPQPVRMSVPSPSLHHRECL
ncbi:MAG: PD40 domain-containing protein [Fibrobacteria bacterium]|nr:PD40 domain-containing protein [Fibrobacteria bacterium]